jgi:hypothetical protein
VDLTPIESNTLLVLGLLPNTDSVRAIANMTKDDLSTCEAAVASLCARELVVRAGDRLGLTKAGYHAHLGGLLTRAAEQG